MFPHYSYLLILHCSLQSLLVRISSYQIHSSLKSVTLSVSLLWEKDWGYTGECRTYLNPMALFTRCGLRAAILFVHISAQEQCEHQAVTHRALSHTRAPGWGQGTGRINGRTGQHECYKHSFHHSPSSLHRRILRGCGMEQMAFHSHFLLFSSHGYPLKDLLPSNKCTYLPE